MERYRSKCWRFYRAFVCMFVFVVMLSGEMKAQLGNFRDEVKGKVKSHIEADPLTISGNLGGSLQTNWNNRDVYSNASPFAATAYANFDIGIYGFHIPVNINLLNVAATQFSFPRPQLTLNTTPQWKNFRFHLGTSSMHFSNYTYSGLTFTGLGAEYQGKLLRAAAFYGILNAPTRFKEQDNRSAIQYYADSLLGLNVQESELPQFKRAAWGGKIGIGSQNNYIDLSVFKAKDDINSLPAVWVKSGASDSTFRDSVVQAKENLDLGLSGRFQIGRWFGFTANAGMSLLSRDLTGTVINKESLSNVGVVDTTDATLKKVLNILDKMSWLYEPRINTQVRFAGDAAANFNFRKLSAVFTYRFVQADYASLGANRFSQNSQGFGGNINTNFFRGRSYLTLTGYLQNDNLDHKQMYTNQVMTYSLTSNNTISSHLSVALSFSGIHQSNKDGLLVVNDTTRLDQLTHTLTISPTYSFTTTGKEHAVSVNFNSLSNKNRNIITGGNSDVSTTTAGLNYDLTFVTSRIGVGVNYDYVASRMTGNSYNSHSFGGSVNYTLAKKKDLNLKIGYSLALAFNDRLSDADDAAADIDADNHTNDISFSNRANLNLSYKQQHTLQFAVSTSNYSENIVIGQRIATDFDLRLSLSYNYTFAKRIIKSKKQSEEEPKPQL